MRTGAGGAGRLGVGDGRERGVVLIGRGEPVVSNMRGTWRGSGGPWNRGGIQWLWSGMQSVRRRGVLRYGVLRYSVRVDPEWHSHGHVQCLFWLAYRRYLLTADGEGAAHLRKNFLLRNVALPEPAMRTQYW
jgi:hypothetical protein